MSNIKLLIGAVVVCFILLFVQKNKLAESLQAGMIEAIETKTGFKASFAGDAVTKLGMSPVVVLPELTVAGNIPSDKKLFTAQKVNAEMDLFSLLSGKVKINKLTFEDSFLELETAADGNGNWTVHPHQGSASKRDVTVGAIEFKTAEIAFQKEGGSRYRLVVPSFSATGTGGGTFDVRAETVFRKTPFSVTGRVDMKQNGVPFNLSVKSAQDALSVKGIADLKNGSLNSAVSFESQAIYKLAELLRIDWPLPVFVVRMSADVGGPFGDLRAQNVKLSLGEDNSSRLLAEGNVSGFSPFAADFALNAVFFDQRRNEQVKTSGKLSFASGFFRLSDFLFEAGGSDLQGNLMLNTQKSLNLKGAFSSTRFNLDQLSSAFAKTVVRLIPSGRKNRTDRIFSENMFSETGWNDAVIDLSVSVESLNGADGTSLGMFNFKASMANGNFKTDRVTLGKYAFSAAAASTGTDGTVSARIQTGFDKMPLSILKKTFSGTLNGGLSLESSGRSPALMAAALRGNMSARIKDVAFLFKDLMNPPRMLASVLPSPNKKVVIDCAVLKAPVKGGAIDSRAIFGMEGNFANMLIGGRLNFGTETQDLTIKTDFADGGIKQIGNEMTVKGSFSKPNLNISVGNAVNKLAMKALSFLQGVNASVVDENVKNACAVVSDGI